MRSLLRSQTRAGALAREAQICGGREGLVYQLFNSLHLILAEFWVGGGGGGGLVRQGDDDARLSVNMRVLAGEEIELAWKSTNRGRSLQLA